MGAEAQAARTQLHGLTMLRAFGAALVVIFHVLYAEPEATGFFGSIVQRGYIGVDLFFVLSGFVLAHVYSSSIASGQFSFWAYAQNRFARIYPLHIATLLLLIVGTLIAPSALKVAGLNADWGDLYIHVLMLQAWALTDLSSWNFPDWTISAEFAAYLALPFIVRVMWRLSPVQAVAVALVVHAAVLGAVSNFGMNLYYMDQNFGALRLAPQFLVGLALFRLMDHWPTSQSRQAVLGLVISFALFLMSLGFQWDLTFLTPLLGAIVYFAAVADLDPRAGSILRGPLALAVYLGKISYATYLVHMPVVIGMRAAMEYSSSDRLPISATVAIIAVIYAASVLLHHGVEEPCRKALRARPKRAVRHTGDAA